MKSTYLIKRKGEGSFLVTGIDDFTFSTPVFSEGKGYFMDSVDVLLFGELPLCLALNIDLRNWK